MRFIFHRKIAPAAAKAALALFARIFRILAERLPSHAPLSISRRLVLRANTARDAGDYAVAAALYEEALRFNSRNLRLHIQCGHMYKEVGSFAAAEEHYAQALGLGPATPDLSLQLGHFYKVAGRPDEAEAAYRRALEFRPGWSEAIRELAAIGSPAVDEEERAQPAAGADAIIPELLPRPAARPYAGIGSGIRIRRLGAQRLRSPWGMLKALRGVEAIRGFCLASSRLTEVQILVNDELVRRAPLQIFPAAGAQTKYVFNLWHDFSGFAPGRYAIELRFVEAVGHARVHREIVLIAPTVAEAEFPDSDALVAPPSSTAATLEDDINARPSMIRAVERRPLSGPIRTILVQRVDQLGDFVCSVPAIRKLRALFPDAQLIGLVSSFNVDLAKSLNLFDAVIVADFPVDPASGHRTMSAEAQRRLGQALSRYDFDLAIDLCQGSESRPILLLSRARFLYGFKNGDWPWLSAGLDVSGFDPVNGIETITPSRKMVALVETLGAMLRSDAAAIPNLSLERERLQAYGIRPDEAYVLIHAGARLAYSRWPHVAEFVRLVLAETDIGVVLIGDEAECCGLDLVERENVRLRILDCTLPFEDFEALLSFCSVFVGNDSGPKHLAALRGAPVVSLHMARLNWSEWGQEISGVIISRRVPCAGCAIAADGEECGKDFACLREIKPREVLNGMMTLL